MCITYSLLRRLNIAAEINLLKDKPLKDMLAKLGGWPVVEGKNWNEGTFQWQELVKKLRTLGLGHSIFFDLAVSNNAMNSSTYTIEVRIVDFY